MENELGTAGASLTNLLVKACALPFFTHWGSRLGKSPRMGEKGCREIQGFL